MAVLFRYRQPPVPRAAPPLALALLLLGALLAGCQQPNYRLYTVKIGLVAPLSGEHFNEGYRWLYAARQAVAAWNGAARARPYRVELVAYDEAEGPAVARRLVLDPDVLGVVGHGDLTATALADYGAAGLPLLFVGTANPPPPPTAATARFQLTPTAEALARGAGLFAAKELNKSTIAVVAGPHLQDLALGETLRAAAAALDLPMVRAEAALPFSTDYGGPLARLALAGPQAVLYAGSAADAHSFQEQYRHYRGWGQKPPLILALRGGSPARIQRGLGPPGEVYWVSGGGDPRLTNAGRSFWSEYQERWHLAPTPLAATVYDGTNLLLQAIAATLPVGQEGPPPAERRQRVREFLQGSPVYRGVAREYAFDGRGGLLNPRVYVFRLEEEELPGSLAAAIALSPAPEAERPRRQ